jgi:hypothetical protein
MWTNVYMSLGFMGLILKRFYMMHI